MAAADRLAGRPRKRTGADIQEIGRVLGARYVLEGSVRKAGNRVRFGGAIDQQLERRPCPSLLSRAAPTFQTSAVRDSDGPMRATCIALLAA